MREIKFRAWDGKVMRYYCLRGFLESRKCLVFHENFHDELVDDYFYLPENKFDGEIMQFTGLRDKNGVEIWEHDILDVERTDSFPMFNKAVVVYSDYYGAFLMQYTNECEPSWIIVKESIRSTDGTAIFEYCTGWPIAVIGNIHENTDLLDSSKVTESVTEGE